MPPLLPVLLVLALVLAVAGGLVGCAHVGKNPLPPLHTVAQVDLDRFMGDWYVQGIIPWFFERGNVGTMDIYQMRPDGRIAITYAYRKGSLDAPLKELHAVARVFNEQTRAEWRVQFLWPFEAPFLIIDLDAEYQTTVIGHPSRNLLWIMSRQPILDDASYQAILQRVAAQHYDVSRVVRIPQRPEPNPPRP